MSSTQAGPWWWFSPWSRRDFRRKSRRKSHFKVIKLPRGWQSWRGAEALNLFHHHPNFHPTNLWDRAFLTLFKLQNPTSCGISSTATSQWGNFVQIPWDAEHEPVGDPPNPNPAPQRSRDRHRCAKLPQFIFWPEFLLDQLPRTHGA